MAFKTRLVKRPQGGSYEERWCFLTEDQALYVMTLSRNSDRVRECKRKLVKGFSAARKELENRETTPKTQAQALLESVQLIVQIEQRQKQQELIQQQHEQRITAIEIDKEIAQQELFALPFSDNPAPVFSTRAKINRIIRSTAKSKLLDPQGLWNEAYTQLYYRGSYDVRARVRHSGLTKLDQIERDGMIDIFFAIVSAIYGTIPTANI